MLAMICPQPFSELNRRLLVKPSQMERKPQLDCNPNPPKSPLKRGTSRLRAEIAAVIETQICAKFGFPEQPASET